MRTSGREGTHSCMLKVRQGVWCEANSVSETDVMPQGKGSYSSMKSGKGVQGPPSSDVFDIVQPLG